MNGVVGRTASGVQAHNGVHNGALVDHFADRGIGIAKGGDLRRALGRRPGQRIAQRGAGINKGGARQMQTHNFHQHLVGIGGAVKGTGAGSMIARTFGGQQFIAAHLALGIELADAGLFLIGQARWHGAGRGQHKRQMPKPQGTDEEAGDNLVANPQHDRPVKHVVGQGDGAGHGNGITRKER